MRGEEIKGRKKVKVNQLKIGIILSYISMFVSTVISIAYTPIMLRLLGQNEYGLYSLVSAAVSYLGILSFGFGSAFMRYYSRYKVNNDYKNIGRLNGMFMTIFLVIGVIALLAGSVLVMNIEMIFKGSLTIEELNKAKILMLLMVFNIAVSFPASVFDSNVTANERYLFQRIVGLARSVLNPFLVLPLLLLGYKSIAMVVVATILTVASLVINMWYCFKKLNVKFVFNKFDIGLMKEIWIFSFYIFLNMIVDQINWSVDKFILGVYRGTVGVAVYAIGAQFNTYYLSFSAAISSVFIPRINRLVAETNDNMELTHLFTRVGRIQFIVLSFIMTDFIVFGQYLINIWAGNGYHSSYYVALWLMIPVTIPLIQNLGIEIQRAKNMHKFRAIIYTAIAAGNIFLSVPLCKAFGEVGCAIGTAIALLIGNGIIMNWYYHKKVGLDILHFWREIAKFIPALIFPLGLGIIIENVVGIHSVVMFLFLGIIYSLCFVLSMWIFGMNNYEKNLIKPTMIKMLKRLSF